MRNLIRLLSASLTAGFLLTACEGPAGPAGANGNDGPAGQNASATCAACHSSAKVDLYATQYQLSKHEYGEAAVSEAGNTGCGPCHLQEAFKDVVARNVPVAFTIVPPATTYSNPYAANPDHAYGEIGCSTCHSALHTTYDSTNFYPLTSTAAVPMTMWGGTKTINLTQKGGKSNLCVKCHQPRPFTNSNTDKNVLNYDALAANPTQAFYDATMATPLLKPSYRTHTHYGTVGAIVAGKGGVEFTGPITSYTSSAHATAATCQDCHMAPMTGKAGGHTFFAKGNFNGCTTCHPAVNATSQDPAYWSLPRAEIKGLLDQLAAKLVIGGVDILNRNGDATTNLWAGLTTNNYDGYLNIYDPITNTTVQTYNAKSFQYIGTPSSSWTQAQKDYNATLPKITLTNAQMGSLINFQLCLREYSLGIHNYRYCKALLTNSISKL
jgi:hypothetical protein